MTQAMQELINRSMKCYQGMMVEHFNPNVEDQPLDISGMIPKFNGAYCTNNSTVCYVLEDNVYVCPYTRANVDVLNQEGFKKECFYVPFSNWDLPKNEKLEWKKILLDADLQRQREFEEDCEGISQKEIQPIPAMILQNTILIPVDGFMTERMGVKERICPITTNNGLNTTMAEFLGTYACNNGVVTFVTNRGRQYIGRGYGLIGILREAGYSESHFYVPMSNWDRFVDEELQDKWEKIKKF